MKHIRNIGHSYVWTLLVLILAQLLMHMSVLCYHTVTCRGYATRIYVDSLDLTREFI
jgi:hypothetical protein